MSTESHVSVLAMVSLYSRGHIFLLGHLVIQSFWDIAIALPPSLHSFEHPHTHTPRPYVKSTLPGPGSREYIILVGSAWQTYSTTTATIYDLTAHYSGNTSHSQPTSQQNPLQDNCALDKKNDNKDTKRYREIDGHSLDAWRRWRWWWSSPMEMELPLPFDGDGEGARVLGSTSPIISKSSRPDFGTDMVLVNIGPR